MTNGEQIILYLPLAIASGVLLGTMLVHSKGKARGNRSVFFLACIVLWQVLELLYQLTKDMSAADYFFSIKYIPLAFLPVTFFYYAVSFYRIQRVIPRWAPLALLSIPSLTAIIALIPGLSSIFVTKSETGGRSFGFVYYVTNVYAVLVYLAAAVIVVLMCRRLPAAYRRGSAFHILYLSGITVTMLITWFSGDGAGLDIQYYGMSICSLLFYFAYQLNSDTSSLSLDNSAVFNLLDQAVFILNEDGIIVECNFQAQLWLKSLRRNVENTSFDGLLSVLSNNNRVYIKKLEDSSDSDIHFVGTAIPLIFRMERRSFETKEGRMKGEFVTLHDVTRNRLLIDRLRDMAGVDGLTGTANRYRYQDLLRKLDKTEYFPLAVVIGDVNGLKYVNDTFGHNMGDQYIKDIAAVLVDCCPRGGYVARYGGDEFATLLVNTSPETVDEYISEVNKALKAPHDDMVHPPSIALGYAIKHHGNENLSALIGQADQKMYADKMARKAAEREALENA